MTGSNDRAVLHHLLRRELKYFVRQVFTTVSPGDRYLPNWHIDAVCHELVQCLDGQTDRLLINQPPRSLKSICVSVAFVAWAMGHDPKLSFICVSYSQDFSVELARMCRRVMESEWYLKLFPRMRGTRHTRDESITPLGGSRYATSIGGVLTGRGADIIIIDDPIKADEASSDTARKTVNEWYGKTLISRLNDKTSGVIIMVMQRLHEEDLAGHVLEGGEYTHLNLPAIALEDQSIKTGPGSGDVHHRMTGEVLHPEREPYDALMRVKKDQGSQVFNAQYQQSPVPLEGNLVKLKWFETYDSTPEVRRIVQSWDIAGTTSLASDYSVCTTWGVDDKTYYLLHVWRGRLQFPDLKRKVIALGQEHGANTVLIEKVGLGLSLVQELRRDSTPGFPMPIGIVPKGDKQSRLESCSARMEAGQVYLPAEADWKADFLHELLGFPNGKHDDQVDSVSQFLQWKWNDDRPGISMLSKPTVIMSEI